MIPKTMRCLVFEACSSGFHPLAEKIRHIDGGELTSLSEELKLRAL